MPKFSIKWMKEILDWGKRVQFVFQVVMFLFSASVVGGVRAAISYGTHLPALWRPPIYCLSGAVALLCCAAVGNWWSKREAKVEQPVSTNVGKPAATRPGRLRHNVKYTGTRNLAASSDGPPMIVACFQNEPIPHVPLGTFSGAKVKIDFSRGNGEALGEIFPAPWTEHEEPAINLEAGKTNTAAIAAYIEGKWHACEMRTVSTSWGEPTYEIERRQLPMGENLHAVVTLLGDRNISIEPVRLVLKLSPNGKADFAQL
jgi:hypothetical protein